MISTPHRQTAISLIDEAVIAGAHLLIAQIIDIFAFWNVLPDQTVTPPFCAV